MAVWGAPVAKEDDAERAVRAALDLVARCRARRGGRAAGARSARVGVLTGEAAVTTRRAPAGHGRRRPGQHRLAHPVGRRARHGARRRVDAARHRGGDRLRGRRSPRAEGQGRAVPLWRAVRVSPARTAAPALRRPRGAVRRPRPRAAPDQGAVPRLGRGGPRRSWSRSSASPGSASRGCRGSSRSTSTGWPASLLAPRPLPVLRRRRRLLGAGGDGAHAVRQIAEDEEPEPPAPSCTPRSRSRSRPRGAAVGRAAPRPPARPRGASAVATRRTSSPPGGCSSSGWPRSADVLVFEDMQWADAALLDFIEYLLDWSRSHPLFVLALARPELADRRPSWGPASATSARSTWSRCRGGDGRAARRPRPGPARRSPRAILERAEGVPLYAVETVRMLLDRGLLVARGRRLPADRADRDARGPGDPARADRRAARRAAGGRAAAVQDGAVLGKTFTSRRLRALRAGRRPSSSRCSPPRAQGGAVAPGRSALARARPVRVPAGPREAGRLRDAVEEGAARRSTWPPRIPGERSGPRRTRSSRSSPPLPDAYRAGPDAADADEHPPAGGRRCRPRGRAGGIARGDGGGAALLRAGAALTATPLSRPTCSSAPG